MNLIKIGNTIINVDNVAYAENGYDDITFYFSRPVMDEMTSLSIKAENAEYQQASAAYAWLTSACLFDGNDTEPPTEDDSAETEALRERVAELEAERDTLQKAARKLWSMVYDMRRWCDTALLSLPDRHEAVDDIQRALDASDGYEDITTD